MAFVQKVSFKLLTFQPNRMPVDVIQPHFVVRHFLYIKPLRSHFFRLYDFTYLSKIVLCNSKVRTAFRSKDLYSEYDEIHINFTIKHSGFKYVNIKVLWISLELEIDHTHVLQIFFLYIKSAFFLNLSNSSLYDCLSFFPMNFSTKTIPLK